MHELQDLESKANTALALVRNYRNSHAGLNITSGGEFPSRLFMNAFKNLFPEYVYELRVSDGSQDYLKLKGKAEELSTAFKLAQEAMPEKFKNTWEIPELVDGQTVEIQIWKQ